MRQVTITVGADRLDFFGDDGQRFTMLVPETTVGWNQMVSLAGEGTPVEVMVLARRLKPRDPAPPQPQSTEASKRRWWRR